MRRWLSAGKSKRSTRARASAIVPGQPPAAGRPSRCSCSRNRSAQSTPSFPAALLKNACLAGFSLALDESSTVCKRGMGLWVPHQTFRRVRPRTRGERVSPVGNGSDVLPRSALEVADKNASGCHFEHTKLGESTNQAYRARNADRRATTEELAAERKI